jgi:hypothetical protein
MISELTTTAGLALEALTSLYPQHFLVLAASGNFTRAVGKTMGKPCHRCVCVLGGGDGRVGG